METNFVKLYLELNKTLIKTLVVKCTKSVNAINSFIKLKYGANSVDELNPRTWKYYLNISGDYHPLDTPMLITSLDTLEEIIFSKENLEIHSYTKEQYQYQSRYYYSLLDRYPDQEQLILGILYPVDIDKAIAAEDNSILGYPSHLVEPQELTLIQDLESYIKSYQLRWDVKAFALSHSLYAMTQRAIMFLNLVPKLMNLRLERCKTHEAHSFHIRQYLASHGGLDRFMPYMTLKQALYLYRNICYLERNSGKEEQFQILVDKFLTERYIPLSEFSVRHLNSFNEQYYPKLIVRRKAVNPRYNVPEQDYVALEALYEKERPLVYGNNSYLNINEASITRNFQNSISSIIQSKDLESSMVDYNDAVLDPLETVLLRQWVYMASHNLYNVVVNFKDPKTFESRSLYALDAFIYMNYVWCQSIGFDLTTIPNYTNFKYVSANKPSINDLLSVVDTKFTDLRTLAINLLARQPNIVNCSSTGNFFKLSYRVYEDAMYHWFVISTTEDLYKRGYVDNMVSRLYKVEEIVFPVQTYNMLDWLQLNNLPVYNFSYDEAQELVRNIFLAATGLTIDSSKILANIQKAMIAILEQLSSYSVQFIKDINDSKIKPLNWAAIRAGNVTNEFQHYQYVPNEIRIIDSLASSSESYPIETDVTKNISYFSTEIIAQQDVPIELTVTKLAPSYQDVSIYFHSFSISAEYPEYNPAVSNNATFLGWENYLALTTEQKNQLSSIY